MTYYSEFCLEMKAIVHSICRQVSKQTKCEKMEQLTTMQIWIMHYLYENQCRDVYQRDLENDFNIRRSTVTGILQILERKRYICRESVSHDARLKKITLTENAVTLYKEILQNIFILEERMTQNITEEEWEVFYSVLGKLKENLKSFDHPD